MNTIDIGLAFIEGLALIASPCILPVLPLVLAASADGGRRRPYGIIIGFVAAFTLFALASRKLVLLLGLDLDVVKGTSLVLLALFALVLLSSKLSAKFSALTQSLADFGNRLAPAGAQGGLLSGIGLGALIGLVWTPCAGPILAAVLVQVIRQQSDLASYLTVSAFAVGAAVPMLIIALSGRKLLHKLGFLTRHTEAVRRSFGVLILLAVAYIASGADVQTLFSSNNKSVPLNSATALQDGLPQPYPAPEFAATEAWLNGPALTMSQLKGKVVLVDFWTYSCINCVRTLPYLTEWDKRYREQGLVIVGVHSPEFEFEKDIANVKAAIAQHGIRYPVALDNQFATWLNFKNRYWPAHYLINREGQVVYIHYGEGKYDVTENNIRYLLGLQTEVSTPPPAPAMTSAKKTAETYLGYGRAKNFGGTGQLVRDAQNAYRFPDSLPDDKWALRGTWNVEAEKIVTRSKGAALRLDFTARKVFLVLGNASGKPLQARLKLNGHALGAMAGKDAPSGVVNVERNTLYELIDQGKATRGVLELEADKPGLELYAFTFG